jgi:hypothetical protein
MNLIAVLIISQLGIPVYDHSNDPMPRECGDSAGCYIHYSDNTHHIWYANPDARAHELDHVDYGEWHTEWVNGCARVVKRTARFYVGRRICSNGVY